MSSKSGERYIKNNLLEAVDKSDKKNFNNPFLVDDVMTVTNPNI